MMGQVQGSRSLDGGPHGEAKEHLGEHVVDPRIHVQAVMRGIVEEHEQGALPTPKENEGDWDVPRAETKDQPERDCDQ